MNSLIARLIILAAVLFPARAAAITADSFNPNSNGNIDSITIQSDGKIIVGGGFTTIAGQSRNYLARLNHDGSLDTGFDLNVGSAADCAGMQCSAGAVIQSDGKIIVVGSFTAVGGQSRSNLARVNQDGSVDATFNPLVPAGSVRSMAIQSDGKILLTGFSWMGPISGGQSVGAVSRLNPDGALDASFNSPGTDGAIYSIAIQSDGKVVAVGGFTSIGGVGRNNIARFNQDGSLDATFNPGANGEIFSIAIQSDGKIIVGGGYSTTSIGGQTTGGLARLNQDGSLDTTFAPNGNSVRSIAIQSDGKIVVVGDFESMGGQTRRGVARLNSDGSLDTAFDAKANAYIYSVAIQPDGNIIVGGYFTSIAGVTRNRIARLTDTDKSCINQDIGAISFSPTQLFVDATTTASATTTSGLPVTFSSITKYLCTVNGSTVTGINVGYCYVTAEQNGDDTYCLATLVMQYIYVGPAPVTTTTTTTTPSTTTTTLPPWTTTTTPPTTTTSSTTVPTTITTPSTTTTTLHWSFVPGWNLVGNGSSGMFDVATVFGDESAVTTVWKWIANSAKWAFYAPSLVGQTLIDYATGKGYDVLTTINGGEGFWVNAKTVFTKPLPAGAPITSISFQAMPSGWNLIATGDGKTPSRFNTLAAPTTPLTTLWAWDATLANWYFYAPSLEAKGGTALADYITSKNYLGFGTRALDPTMGFWANKP